MCEKSQFKTLEFEKERHKASAFKRTFKAQMKSVSLSLRKILYKHRHLNDKSKECEVYKYASHLFSASFRYKIIVLHRFCC